MCTPRQKQYEQCYGTSCAECAHNDGKRLPTTWFEGRNEYLCSGCIEYLTKRNIDLGQPGYKVVA